jgi:hypothetical protein
LPHKIADEAGKARQLSTSCILKAALDVAERGRIHISVGHLGEGEERLCSCGVCIAEPLQGSFPSRGGGGNPDRPDVQSRMTGSVADLLASGAAAR